MWWGGLIVALAGMALLAAGAAPRSGRDRYADQCVRRGGVLVPLGLGMMFSQAPDGGSLPREFVATYVVFATLLGGLVVARFSEHREEEDDTPVARPSQERLSQRMRDAA